MNPLIISLGAGVLIGLFYALLRVRSPAPPAIALIGLLGMIIGGQITAQIKPHHQTSALSVQSENRHAAITYVVGEDGTC